MYFRSVSTACLLIALLFSGTSSQADIVTAAFLPSPQSHGGFHIGAGKAIDPPSPNAFDNRQVQTFLATASGAVSRVSFKAHQSANTTAPLRVEVTTLEGGRPGESLGHAIVPIADFPSDPSVLYSTLTLNIDAIFPDNDLLLSAGTPYALVFWSETSNANYRLYGTDNAPGYPDGERAFSQNGVYRDLSSSSGDLFFEVAVNPVPEPSSLLLAGIGAVGLLVGLRRKIR